jgi:hypothetical protein
LLSLPSPLRGRKAITGGAVALLATLAVAGPAGAATAPTTAPAGDSGGATTSFHFVMYSSGADSYSQDSGFTMIERKAG